VIFPSSLKSLTFGTLCNQSLERIHFPDGLQELTLGGTGNKNMIEGRDWAKYSSLKWFTNVVYHNALIKDNNYNLIYVYSIYIYICKQYHIYIYICTCIYTYIYTYNVSSQFLYTPHFLSGSAGPADPFLPGRGLIMTGCCYTLFPPT
jgi:hypothetical protein